MSVTSKMLKQMEHDIVGVGGNAGGGDVAIGVSLPASTKATLPALRDEKLGPLASEAVLKMTSEAAASLEGLGEELKQKVHELSLAIQKMNEDTTRQLNELDSLMKSSLMSVANATSAVRDDGAQRAKMIADVAENLRRVDQQCQSMRHSINGRARKEEGGEP